MHHVLIILLAALLTGMAACGFTPASAQHAPDEAERLLAGLSTEEKVGQIFLTRCPEKEAAQKAAQYHLGGYVLFARDFEGLSKAEVKAKIAELQKSASIPLLIAADEEGGTVNRISINPKLRGIPFLSPRELYALGGWDTVRSDTVEKCTLFKELGLNVNLAPVCDLSDNPADFIYERSFGGDPEAVSSYVRLVTETMADQGTGSTLKHFPGYGGNADTHTGLAYDARPLSQFRRADFLPFKAGIGAGADMVMVSHNIVEAMDPDHPASISPAVHKILREELGFKGVIVTDDLIMEGIRKFTDDRAAAVAAVLAGNDLLCCSDFETQLPAVLAAVKDGTIPMERLDEAVLRVLRMKLNLGLIGHGGQSTAP